MRRETAAQARERILRDTLARTDLQTALRAIQQCRARMERDLERARQRGWLK